MGRLDGRVAIVTGAARGIGFAVASKLASRGASVAVLDVDEVAAQHAAARLPLAPTARAIGIRCDVSDEVEVGTAVERLVSELGGAHMLVNNAGITRDNLIHKMSLQDWDLVVDVNLRGAFLMARAAQAGFVSQEFGRIVNISSIAALGNRGQANYSAAKMGIQGLTRTLALELGRYGVTVNAVAPGFVATEMTDATAERLGMSVEEFRAANAKRIPVRRVGTVDDIASAVAFLVDDEASYITGQTMYVDGGATLG
ncbi:MAG TPA: beta-ketoacyl-ACP reductase [Microbacteriaceae bacterium]|nr:beta-ketoacyl-ACP reductase [Microbacteriaceae bacterium]